LIVCSDFNVNFLADDKKKQLLVGLLQTFNLSSVVHFPTRICSTTQTLIDNIFIDTTKIDNYNTSPLLNGLSDHDGQLLFLHLQEIHCNNTNLIFKRVRVFSKLSQDEFKLSLSFQMWEDVFNTENSDIDKMFDSFVNTYLKIFQAYFPKKKIYLQCSSKQWVTTGIKTSCDKKRELYHLSKL
jgi:hypothetical protein